MSDQDTRNARRLFLAKAGRFAAATPPAVALMLSANGVARAQAQSSGTTTTGTSTTTATSTTTETTGATTTTVPTTSTP